MADIDYKAIKEIAARNHEKVFDFLGLQMKRTHPDQFRGPDPVCGRGGDRILVYTISEQRWCCHSKICSPKDGRTKGGDLIYLTAHVKGVKQSDAAKLLRDRFMREPEKPKSVQKRRNVNRRAKGQAKGQDIGQALPVGGTDTGTIADFLNL